MRLQESSDTLGRAAKVGVTARDVGHVGGVVLGKGTHVPPGSERGGYRLQFPWVVICSPCVQILGHAEVMWKW